METAIKTIIAQFQQPAVFCQWPDKKILAANPAFSEMISEPLKQWKNQVLDDWITLHASASGALMWQQGQKRFLVKETRIDFENQAYLLVVFTESDDVHISSQLEATRLISELLMHRIRSPLTAMQGFAEMITQADLEKEAILDGIGEIRLLLDDMESFVSPPPAELNIVDAHAILNQVLSQLQTKDRQRILIQKHPDFGTVRSHAETLRAIFEELVSNALEHATGELDEITISFSSNGSILFTNGGPVIPKNLAKRIFLPFITTKARHNGLGLAKVWRWLEKLQARIELVKNSATEGIVFRLTLPIKKD